MSMNYFRYYLLLEECMVLYLFEHTWITITQESCVPRLVEICLAVLEKFFFKAVNVLIYYVIIISPCKWASSNLSPNNPRMLGSISIVRRLDSPTAKSSDTFA